MPCEHCSTLGRVSRRLSKRLGCLSLLPLDDRLGFLGHLRAEDLIEAFVYNARGISEVVVQLEGEIFFDCYSEFDLLLP